jgi:hypothetical protein
MAARWFLSASPKVAVNGDLTPVRIGRIFRHLLGWLKKAVEVAKNDPRRLTAGGAIADDADYLKVQRSEPGVIRTRDFQQVSLLSSG